MNTAEKIYEHVKALPEPVVQEILDFVEFIEMKLAQPGMDASRVRAERLRSMRSVRGIWKDRNDLPDFPMLRRELERAQGEGS